MAHLTNFSFCFLWNFHRRCLSTSSRPWCKKVKNDQKLKSRGSCLKKLPKMWRLLMRVEKRLVALSLMPEPTRRNVQHLKDYPVFQVLFFDLRTLAVSWSTWYASAQRAELHDSRTACARVENSKARVPRYEPQNCAHLHIDELPSGQTNTRWASNRKLKNELRRAYEFVHELLRGWN